MSRFDHSKNNRGKKYSLRLLVEPSSVSNLSMTANSTAEATEERSGSAASRYIAMAVSTIPDQNPRRSPRANTKTATAVAKAKSTPRKGRPRKPSIFTIDAVSTSNSQLESTQGNSAI